MNLAWIVDKESSQEELAARFRQQMEDAAIMQIPGAHDGISALIAKKIGFNAPICPGPPIPQAGDFPIWEL